MKQAGRTAGNLQKYRHLVDNLRSGVIICAPVGEGDDFLIVDLNHTAKSLNKTVKEELIGKSFGKVFPILAANGVMKVLKEVLTSGKSVRLPFTTLKDQRIAEWIDYFVLRLQDGEIVIIFDDLTAAKLTEEKLVKSEERLALSLNILNVGLWDWHIPTDKVFYSDLYFSMAGYRPGDFEASYRGWQERVHPDDLPAAEERIKAVLKSPDTAYETEFRYLRKEGYYMWIQAKGRIVELDAKGHPLRMLGTHTDITPLKTEAERIYQNALEAVERQKTLLEISRLYHSDFRKTWQSITQQAAGILRADRVSIWALSDDSSRLICQYLHPQDSSGPGEGTELVCRHYPRYFSALETSRYIDASNGITDPRTGEFTEGYLIPLHIVSMLDVPVRQGGKLAGVICFEYTGKTRHWSLEEKEFAASLADLLSAKFEAMDRDAAQRALEVARQKAEESDRLKTSLLANMSHELRTPMNSILGFSELLLQESVDKEVLSYTKKIHISGKRLMNTLQAILELADLEATRSNLHLTQVDLAHLLASLLPPLQAQASEKGLYLIADIPPGSLLTADETLLRLVLQNLIDNAVKFTKQGGVTIEYPSPSGEGAAWSWILVKDTGIGISEENFERIFQEFRQVSEGYDRMYEGAGLGLTLSGKMVQLMGGSIAVESKPGQGSVFTVRLPRPADPPGNAAPTTGITQEKATPPVTALEGPARLPLVLAIEDNDDNAEIVKLYLKSACQIDLAPDGATAMKLVEQKQYRAILLDINLGTGTDGLQIVERLRGIRAYKKIPVIALTGYTMAEDRERIMKAGCTHYLAKPFTKSELVTLLSDALLDSP